MARKKAWRPSECKVYWLDAYESLTLQGTLGAIRDRAKLTIRETRGFLVHQDGEDVPLLRRRTILARHYDPPSSPGEEPEVDSIIVIPTVLVVKMSPNGRKESVREARRSPEEGDQPGKQPGGPDQGTGKDS